MIYSKPQFLPSLLKAIFILAIVLPNSIANKAFAETLYAKKSGVALKESASGSAKDIGTLGKGEAVEIVKKDGKYYQAKTGSGKTGWIFKFHLSASAPAQSEDGEGLLAVLGGRGDVSANESASSSSIRGLSPVSEKHAKDKGISEADIQAVKDMENLKITSTELKQFLAQRKLGPFSE